MGLQENTTNKYNVLRGVSFGCSAFFFIQNVRKWLLFRKKLWFWWSRVPGYAIIGDTEVEDDGYLGDNNGVTGLNYSHLRVIAS